MHKPTNDKINPIKPKKCNGLVKYLFKNNTVIRSKKPWYILELPYLLTPYFLSL